jgi:hypothetical protein
LSGSEACPTCTYHMASISMSTESYSSRMGNLTIVIKYTYRILLSELVGELEGFRVENIHSNPKS